MPKVEKATTSTISHLSKMRDPVEQIKIQPKRMRHPLVETYTEKAVDFGISEVRHADVNFANEGFFRRYMLERVKRKQQDQMNFSSAVIF